MSHPPRLRLFGVPALLNGGDQAVKLRTSKQLASLVYLVLEGRDQPVPRDRLVDLLWDDVTADRGRHSLAQACSAIRAALGPKALERAGTAIRLAATVVTDLDRISEEFDRLPLAEPLLEAEWWAGPGFGHWVDGARTRLRRAAEDALRTAIAQFRRSGETKRVHDTAAVLYRLDPLSDVAVHALAERELIVGDVVAAIRLLRAHQARVQEALGCTPHKDVERLLRRLEAGSHPPIERVPARLAAEAPALRPTVFVGREKELAHLESEWQRAAEGGFRSCLLLGPGGIGKSSLVRRFAATVAARAQPIFLVTCQEIGEGIPFAALSDLITAMSRDPSLSATDPKWLAEVARIHPALRMQYPGIPEAPEAPPESIRLRVAEGMFQMLDAVGNDGPVGIVFDDLPFMDQATRDVLHVLGRRLGDRCVLFVAAARTPDLLAGPFPAFQGSSLLHWTSCERLLPLESHFVREMASALSPGLALEVEVLERIQEISDGNPHFTEMLVSDWEQYRSTSIAGGQTADGLPGHWQPPESSRQAFERTYAGLSALSQEVLQALAVAGRSLGVGELGEQVFPQAHDLAKALTELLRRGVLRLDDGSISFKNELQRALVYYAGTLDIRNYFHSRIGRALLAQSEKTGEHGDMLEAARHLTKAGLQDDAVTAVLTGVPLAIGNGAPREAELAVRTVLSVVQDEANRCELELLLAEALCGQGHYADCLNVLDQARLDATLSSNRLAVAALLKARCLQRSRSSDDITIREAAVRAVTLAKATNADQVLAAAAQVLAEAASEAGNSSLLAEATDTTSKLAASSRSPATRAQAMLTTAFCLMTNGRYDLALKAFADAADSLKAASMEPEFARALNGRAISLVGLGRHREAVQALSTAISVATKLNDTGYRSILISNLGVTYEEVGLFSYASRCYEETLIRRASTDVRSAMMAQLNVAHVALVEGHYDRAATALAIARDEANKSQSWRLAAMVDYGQADLMLALGEPERAWPLVIRASSQTWGRERGLDTNGRAIRLMLHCGLATGGQSRFGELLADLAQARRPLRIADAHEISGFLAWVTEQGLEPPGGIALAELSEVMGQLVGPIAALAAVGTVPTEWAVAPGESPARMVDRVFPDLRQNAGLRPLEEVLWSRGFGCGA